MERTYLNDELIPRYLLGDLPEEERLRLEEEYFADNDFFERLLAAEDELIDAYVRGELSEGERARFESRFLTTERRRERVAFAEELMRSVASARTTKAATLPAARVEAPSRLRSLLVFPFARRPAFAFTLAAIALALLAGVVWLVLERTPRRNDELEARRAAEVREREAARRRAPNSQTNENGASENRNAGGMRLDNANAPETVNATPERVPVEERASQTPPSPRESAPPVSRKRHAVVSLILSPGLVRGGDDSNSNTAIIIDPANINSVLPPTPAPTSGLNFGGQRGVPQNRLVLPRGTDFVRLRLMLKAADAYESYSATLETVEGREVWRRGALRASAGASGARRLSLSVPANVLRTAGYILKLSGGTRPAESEDVAEYYFSVVKR